MQMIFKKQTLCIKYIDWQWSSGEATRSYHCLTVDEEGRGGRDASEVWRANLFSSTSFIYFCSSLMRFFAVVLRVEENPDGKNISVKRDLREKWYGIIDKYLPISGRVSEQSDLCGASEWVSDASKQASSASKWVSGASECVSSASNRASRASELESGVSKCLSSHVPIRGSSWLVYHAA